MLPNNPLFLARMMDPIVLYYGKGQLTGFLVDPNGVLDVVSTPVIILFSFLKATNLLRFSGKLVFYTRRESSYRSNTLGNNPAPK